VVVAVESAYAYTDLAPRRVRAAGLLPLALAGACNALCSAKPGAGWLGIARTDGRCWEMTGEMTS